VRTCPVCVAKFIPRGHRTVYCSDYCSRQANRDRARARSRHIATVQKLYRELHHHESEVARLSSLLGLDEHSARSESIPPISPARR
jgi:predicted nucleic acid-binding Zn ribbon protein